MAVNYEDERLAQVESDKQEAISEYTETTDQIIANTDGQYQSLIDASKEWGDKQAQLQQEQTDFTIEQIEQQKAQAQKDYTKEQSGAYVDWQKQSNQYGADAEKMAASGLAGTGFSESSQVSMYNTYQNRVASARESYNRAVLNYDNAIKDARLQNNSVLAEIAYQSLQTQLELSLEGFQYKNQLLLEQANKKIELDNEYYNRYLGMLDQINTENALAEQQRQFDQSYALDLKKYNEQVRQFDKSYDLQIKEYNEGIRQFNEEIKRLREKDAKEYQLEIENLELKKKQMEEEKRQFEKEQQFKRDQLAEQKRQFNAQQSTNSASIGRSSSSSSKSSGSSSSISKSSTSNGSKIDNKSVANLGRGPVSADYLAELVATGQVVATQKGNTISFKNNSNAAAGQAALNKYTWTTPSKNKGGGGGKF